MFRPTSGASVPLSSLPSANGNPPIVPTPLAKAVRLVRQGHSKLVSPVQSAEKKPVHDSSVVGLKPLGGGRKKTIASIQERKQQCIALLSQHLQKYEGQQKQVQEIVDNTRKDMLSKQNDPSCSEQERAKVRQRYVVGLNIQSKSYDTLLAEIRKLDELRGDPDTTQLQCDLLNNLVNNARARIAIAGLDLEATERNYPHSNSNAVQIYTAMHTEGTVVVDGLLEYMDKSSEIYETLIKLHEDVGKRLHKLKSMSPQGAKAWQRLTSNRPDNQVTALRTRFNQVVTLPTLSAKVPGSDTSAALFSAIEPLLLLSTSHIELQALQHYESGDRIAVLANLIEHYDTAKLGLTSIGIFRTDELQPAPFSRLCEIVGQLHDDAERRLADELQNLADSEKSSPKSTADQLPANRPSSSPSRKRVIKTVNGAMIGDVRPRVAKQGADIVDIKSPFEDQPLASFHENKPNAWVEIEKARTPAPKTRATPYPQLMGDARKALAKIDELMQKFEGYARGTSHPKGIEESLQNTAKNLIDYADRLKNHEHAPQNSQNDAAFVSKLRGQAQTINDKATQLRTRMSLTQAPTSAAVEYLLSRNEIHPQKNGERIQLKTGRQDFLQEYVLSDRNNKPVWYAHFHYEKLTDAKADYTVASLKTAAQRFATNATALAQAQNPHQKIDIYRGHIDKELATKFFLLP